MLLNCFAADLWRRQNADLHHSRKQLILARGQVRPATGGHLTLPCFRLTNLELFARITGIWAM
jgi:hypothetical protein